MDPNTPVNPVYTYADGMQDEQDKKISRWAMRFQLAAAIVTFLFFLRALIQRD